MKWQKLSRNNPPPVGVPIDIITNFRGKPRRQTNCQFMRSLEVFRTEIALRDIQFKDVTHWQVVTLPGDEKEIVTVEDSLECIANTSQLVVKLIDGGLPFLDSKDKRDAAFQLRGIIHHLQKTGDIIVASQQSIKPTMRFDI